MTSRWPLCQSFGQEAIVTRCARNYGPFQAPDACMAQIDHLRLAGPARCQSREMARKCTPGFMWKTTARPFFPPCSAVSRARSIISRPSKKATDLEVAHWILDQLGKPRENGPFCSRPR